MIPQHYDATSFHFVVQICLLFLPQHKKLMLQNGKLKLRKILGFFDSEFHKNLRFNKIGLYLISQTLSEGKK